MAESQSKVRFQPENSNVDFQPDDALGRGADQSGWRPFAGQEFSWNKAAIGVGAAAALAGAAYAASRYMGRGSEDEQGAPREREFTSA